MSEDQSKPDLAGLVAHIAREECRRLYEKRLAGLEEELAAVYRTLDEYAHNRLEFTNHDSSSQAPEG